MLYSDRWLDSVPYFQVLCIAGMGGCLTSVNTQAIAAIGKSKEMFQWTIVKRGVGVLAIVGGLILYGMKGLLIGMVFNSWFSYFVNIFLVSKYIRYQWLQQIYDLIPIVVVCLITTAISYFVGRIIDLGMYWAALVELIVFVSIYMGWSLLFKPESYTFFLSAIPEKLKFRK